MESFAGADLHKPDKNWKFSVNDVHERQHWNDYMQAYEDMIRHTATKEAPWYIVPADNSGLLTSSLRLL